MRLSSGLWQMKLGEINDALTGWREGVKREADIDPNAQFIGGDVERLRLGMEFEAELVLSFSQWMKLGLSFGYAYASVNEEETLLTVEEAGALEERARPTKVSAYPLLVSGYFSLPLGCGSEEQPTDSAEPVYCDFYCHLKSPLLHGF